MFYREKDSKNTQYSRNDIILKIGHFTKAMTKQNGELTIS